MPLRGLAVGVGLTVVLLAWPVWFALDGPAHLSGQIWPNVGMIGGFRWSSFTAPPYPKGSDVYLALGGYAGPPLGSGGLPRLGPPGRHRGRGRGLLARPPALVLQRRPRALRLVSPSAHPPGATWAPSALFARLPLLDDVIEQRFMAFGYLAAAVLLAIVLDHVHDVVGRLARLVVAALAVPRWRWCPLRPPSCPRCPSPCGPWLLPRWYERGGADIAAGPGPAVVPGSLLGHPVGHGLAGGEPHALQPGRRRRSPGRGPSGRLRRPRLPGDQCAQLGFRSTSGDRSAVRLRRRPPCAVRVGGEHGRRGRAQPGRPLAPTGARPDLRRRLLHRSTGSTAHDRGRGLGVAQRRRGSPSCAPTRPRREPWSTASHWPRGAAGRVAATERAPRCVLAASARTTASGSGSPVVRPEQWTLTSPTQHNRHTPVV